MRHRLFIFAVSMSLLTSCLSKYQLHGSPYQQTSTAADLPLNRTGGDVFSLEDIRDQVGLVFFGYTHCPDICPATLAELSWVKDQLGSQGDKLEVIFVSIDPDRDTPEIIRSHLDRFDENFIGLSGNLADLEPILKEYGVVAQKDPGNAEHYTMTHTSRVFLIDQSGNLRSNYTFDEPRESILSDVRYLIKK